MTRTEMTGSVARGGLGATAALMLSLALGVGGSEQATAAPKSSTEAPAAQTFATVAPVPAADDAFAVVEDAVYTPPAPPAPPPRIIPQWKVPADTSLRQVLATWARQEGWEVYWPKVDETTDWVTVVDVTFRANDFEEAARKFAAGLPPEVGIALTFNRANNPKLLHVSEATRRQTAISDGKEENL